MEICYQKHIFHGISFQTGSKKPYLRLVPRTGQFSSESKIAAGLLCLWQERPRTGSGKRRTGKRDEPVDVDFPYPGHLLHGGNGLPLVIISFKREPDNEIDNGSNPGIMAEFRSMDRLRSRMAPVQPGENGIAPRLGAKMESGIGAVIRDRVK